MSVIDEQIKRLTLVKQKIEFAEKLKDPKNLGKWVDNYPEIKDEMMSVLSRFSEKLVRGLESNYSLPTEKEQSSKVEEQRPSVKKPIAQKKELPRQDAISFALENRHLADKRVSVSTEHGVFEGKVVGLDAPHVIVKLDSGATVQRELQDVRQL